MFSPASQAHNKTNPLFLNKKQISEKNHSCKKKKSLPNDCKRYTVIESRRPVAKKPKEIKFWKEALEILKKFNVCDVFLTLFTGSLYAWIKVYESVHKKRREENYAVSERLDFLETPCYFYRHWEDKRTLVLNLKSLAEVLSSKSALYLTRIFFKESVETYDSLYELLRKGVYTQKHTLFYREVLQACEEKFTAGQSIWINGKTVSRMTYGFKREVSALVKETCVYCTHQSLVKIKETGEREQLQKTQAIQALLQAPGNF